ncbi:alpha/beta fold hydrolase [Nonomuraea typhae]|uniref:alpha/beta fold hydrolase n=1 Tax=Nonomuraea typhae TaxID=2603600 RepID=UPI0012FAA99C|nr:alpha/beta hydrolase [Nonomuraea typhae]
MPTATLHDGASIEFEIHGDGPALLLPLNPRPADDPVKAAEAAQWGADLSLGHTLVTGLSDAFRVIAFDYEGHVLTRPKPATLTPDNLARDILAVAGAAGADRFAYYGYSWLALTGLQLAIRTDRLSALVMGGFPPIGGPYKEMLAVTAATHRMALDPQPATPAGETAETGEAAEAGDWGGVQVSMSPEQTQQFVTLYEALQNFDEPAAQERVGCPRLCFAGANDVIEYGPRWGGVTVDIAGPFTARRAEMEAHGWDVRLLDGLDHMSGMHGAAVLPLIRPWLAGVL